MGQELSSRLQVTTFPVSAILLLRHRVNSALECEQSQQQFVVFIEEASRVYDETRAGWRHANVKLPRLQPTAAHGGHGTRLRQQPPQPAPAPLLVTEDRGCRGMMAIVSLSQVTWEEQSAYQPPSVVACPVSRRKTQSSDYIKTLFCYN